MKQPGCMLISLDFELYWGLRDCLSLTDCKSRLEKVHQIIPQLVDIFRANGIHASFATVGMLMTNDRIELEKFQPALLPNYSNSHLSPYNGYLKKIDHESYPLHFAPNLVKLIARTEGLEIGSHTFSHYYCLPNGQDAAAFEDDLKAHVELAKSKGIALKTLVFPRNQYNQHYLEICRKYGIVAFRGNEPSWIYAPRDDSKETALRRAFRLTDAYFNLSGHHTFSAEQSKASQPYNFPSSRFLRPAIPNSKILENLRLKRITRAMDYAAKHGEIFHLWWHPHNFGDHTEANFEFLQKVIDHFQKLRNQYGFESLNMAELAEQLDAQTA
jgi:peptidoglycan/xylan/chitin deacetylase (PgdA/CDA1 family)